MLIVFLLTFWSRLLTNKQLTNVFIMLKASYKGWRREWFPHHNYNEHDSRMSLGLLPERFDDGNTDSQSEYNR